MVEFINLRQARKRADRAKREREAEQNRLAHGEPKHVRKQRGAEAERKARDLAGKRRTTEET
jgi:Domain of unknown function (DUF4169)